MERFFKLLYYYILVVFVLFVAYMVTMLALSPKKDMQKRGFIPCTEQLVLSVSACERGQMMCPLKWLWQDTVCNAEVILDGFGAWVKGEQPSPWASYLFEPEIAETVENDEPYEGNVQDDMQELEAQRLFVEQKQKELDAAKNREMNFDETVIISESDEDESGAKDVKADEPEEYVNPEGEAAIADEAFMEDIAAEEADEADRGENVAEEGEKNE